MGPTASRGLPAFASCACAPATTGRRPPPREEWLIAEWPEGRDEPTDYWISNLAADAEPETLARLARLRWKIELDYKQLKGQLGLDHYKAAPGLAGITTPPWSPPPADSSPSND
jgi:Transposase DDE domain